MKLVWMNFLQLTSHIWIRPRNCTFQQGKGRGCHCSRTSQPAFGQNASEKLSLSDSNGCFRLRWIVCVTPGCLYRLVSTSRKLRIKSTNALKPFHQSHTTPLKRFTSHDEALSILRSQCSNSSRSVLHRPIYSPSMALSLLCARMQAPRR
jgi:hypothetical protein